MNFRVNTIVLLLAGLLSEINLFAQDEKLLHINKPFYVEGETIHFKVYNLRNNTKSNNTALIGLYSPDGKHFASQTIETLIENNTLNGQFILNKIPEDGFYLIRIFCHDILLTAHIPVFTKSLPAEYRYVYYENTTSIPDIGEYESKNLLLNTQKESFEELENVSVQISHSNPNRVLNPLMYSISIYKEVGNTYPTVLKLHIDDYPLDMTYGITGTVSSKINGETLPNKLITGYFLHGGMVHSTYSDEKGKINLQPEAIYQNDLIYLQAFTPDGKRIGEVNFEKDLKTEIPFIEQPLLKKPVRSNLINNYIHQFIQEEYVKKNYYSPVGTQMVTGKSGLELEYNFEIRPDEFYEIASLRDAIREIVPYSRIKRIKNTDSETVILKNKQSGSKFGGPPLFFINEVPLLNPDMIFALDYQDIEKIKIINEPRLNSQLHNLGMYGVFKIQLKPDVQNPAEVLLPNFVEMSKTEIPAILNNAKSSCRPCFRGAVYWGSSLYLDKNDTFEVKYPSDFSSYIIEIFGLDRNGVPIGSKKIINRVMQ